MMSPYAEQLLNTNQFLNTVQLLNTNQLLEPLITRSHALIKAQKKYRTKRGQAVIRAELKYRNNNVERYADYNKTAVTKYYAKNKNYRDIENMYKSFQLLFNECI
jgi:hypothetical protein